VPAINHNALMSFWLLFLQVDASEAFFFSMANSLLNIHLCL
jgi:hypothetical protein